MLTIFLRKAGECSMNENARFDPCGNARILLELLYENAMLREAIQISVRLDEAQLKRWQEVKQAAAGA